MFLINKIVWLVAQNKWISAKDLWHILAQDYVISQSNFYKHLAKMIDSQILVKKNKGYYLNTRWVMDILSLSNQIKTTYINDSTYPVVLENWQQEYYKAWTLRELDGIWGEILLSIMKKTWFSEPCYVYHSHPYYSLWMYETEISFFSQISTVSSLYYFSWNESILDQYWVDLYKRSWMNALIVHDLPFLKSWYCLNVVGDYFIEVVFPSEVSMVLDSFFSIVKDRNDFDKTLFAASFDKRTLCKIKVRKDSNQTSIYRKVFQKYI